MIAPECRIFQYETMPRPRTLEPLGVSDNPRIVEDPVREAEIIAELRARQQFLIRHYNRSKAAAQFERSAFNGSLKRLKKHMARVDGGHPSVVSQTVETELHPELALIINLEAKRRAGMEPSAPLEFEHQHHIMAAVRSVAATQRTMRGARSRQLFKRHLEGWVALWVQATGKSIIGHRTKDSVYDPHLDGPSGKFVRLFADSVEPSFTDTTLVDMLGEIRRKYAGKAMRFEDIFPFYGGNIRDGVPHPRPGYRLDAFILIEPIYCP